MDQLVLDSLRDDLEVTVVVCYLITGTLQVNGKRLQEIELDSGLVFPDSAISYSISCQVIREYRLLAGFGNALPAGSCPVEDLQYDF